MAILIIKNKSSKKMQNYKVTSQIFARNVAEDSKMKLFTTVINKSEEIRTVELKENIYYFFAKTRGYITSECVQIDLLNNKSALVEVSHNFITENVKLTYNIKEAEKYVKLSSSMERIDKFEANRKLNNIVLVDEINKVFFIPSSNTIKKFIFEDLESYELVDKNKQKIYTTTKKKGIGRAIVGGAIFGSVGAMVGATTGNSESTTNIENYKIEIIRLHIKSQHKAIDIEIPKYFKNMDIEELLNYFDAVLEENDSMQRNNENDRKKLLEESEDNFTKIRRYKELLDDEIISKEEFEKKKKELLQL